MSSYIVLSWISVLCLFGGCLTKDEKVAEHYETKELYNLQFFNEHLYIGGTDKLLRLDTDLEVNDSISTCHSQCGSNPNINKVLLIVKDKVDKIVTCGTGNQGSCELRSLPDLNVTASTQSMVSTNSRRPALAVMIKPDSLNFVLAVTYSSDLNENIWNPMTIRTVTSKMELQLAGDEVDVVKLKVDESHDIRSSYLIYYKAVLRYGGFTYFATNQKAFAKGRTEYVSKLIRLCDSTENLWSYTDVIIECSNNNVTYNLIQDAVFVKGENSILLVATFVKDSNPENPSGESVICSTDLQTLNSTFRTAVKEFIQCDNETEFEFPTENLYLLAARGKECIQPSKVRLVSLEYY